MTDGSGLVLCYPSPITPSCPLPPNPSIPTPRRLRSRLITRHSSRVTHHCFQAIHHLPFTASTPFTLCPRTWHIELRTLLYSSPITNHRFQAIHDLSPTIRGLLPHNPSILNPRFLRSSPITASRPFTIYYSLLTIHALLPGSRLPTHD